MANLKSIVIALALIFSNASKLPEVHALDKTSIGNAMVFIISVAVLVSRLRMMPKVFWRRQFLICLLLEAACSFIIFELALHCIWRRIQEYADYKAEKILEDTYVTNKKSVEPFICYLCCGKPNCPKILSDLFLKLLSCGLLATIVIAV